MTRGRQEGDNREVGRKKFGTKNKEATEKKSEHGLKKKKHVRHVNSTTAEGKNVNGNHGDRTTSINNFAYSVWRNNDETNKKCVKKVQTIQHMFLALCFRKPNAQRQVSCTNNKIIHGWKQYDGKDNALKYKANRKEATKKQYNGEHRKW